MPSGAVLEGAKRFGERLGGRSIDGVSDVGSIDDDRRDRAVALDANTLGGGRHYPQIPPSLQRGKKSLSPQSLSVLHVGTQKDGVPFLQPWPDGHWSSGPQVELQ